MVLGSGHAASDFGALPIELLEFGGNTVKRVLVVFNSVLQVRDRFVQQLALGDELLLLAHVLVATILEPLGRFLLASQFAVFLRALSLKFARIWGSGVFDGQQVGPDHELADGDVIELHS